MFYQWSFFSSESLSHEEELIVVASLNSADDPFLSKQQQHMFTLASVLSLGILIKEQGKRQNDIKHTRLSFIYSFVFSACFF